MKVLDLQCQHQHLFEGWFANEDDFLQQRERVMIECPVCGDASISKRLSAPRLNLGAAHSEDEPSAQASPAMACAQALQAAWMTLARSVLANTDDVGTQFAEEARRIHYGEAPERGIRGRATSIEADALIEEGIAVLPLPLPDALKGQLQ